MKAASMLVAMVTAITLSISALMALVDLDDNWDRVASTSACWLDRIQPPTLQDQEPAAGLLTLVAEATVRTVHIRVSVNTPGHLSLWNHSSRGHVTRMVPGPSTDTSSAARSIRLPAGVPYPVAGHADYAGQEQIIAIWTREAPAQLRQDHFRCKRVFAQALADLRNRDTTDWAIKTVTLHIP